MSVIMPGVCRHCRCTGESCTLPGGDKCGWFDATRTVCSNCIKAEMRRRADVRAEFYRNKPKRLTSVDIHELKCGRAKKSKRARKRSAA